MKQTILTGRHDPQHASNFARAARNLTKTHATEVNEFCKRLTGLQGETYDDICNEVENIPFPAGYMHVRMFDAEDGVELACAISQTYRSLTTEEMSMLVTLHERFQWGRWVATTPLPTTDSGVLDLLVTFKERAEPLIQ